MNESSDLLKERFKKFQAIEAMGIYPFGGRFLKEGMIAGLLAAFEENKKVRTAGRLSSSAPVQLFNGGWTLSQRFPFDVTPDDRFLMIQQPREAVPSHIDVILNWFTMLNERLTPKK